MTINDNILQKVLLNFTKGQMFPQLITWSKGSEYFFQQRIERMGDSGTVWAVVVFVTLDCHVQTDKCPSAGPGRLGLGLG